MWQETKPSFRCSTSPNVYSTFTHLFNFSNSENFKFNSGDPASCGGLIFFATGRQEFFLLCFRGSQVKMVGNRFLGTSLQKVFLHCKLLVFLYIFYNTQLSRHRWHPHIQDSIQDLAAPMNVFARLWCSHRLLILRFWSVKLRHLCPFISFLIWLAVMCKLKKKKRKKKKPVIHRPSQSCRVTSTSPPLLLMSLSENLCLHPCLSPPVCYSTH